MRPEELTLAINAGGKAERLGGVAKGLLRIGGQTVLERLLTLRGLARDVLLVANDAAPYASYGLRAVADAVPGKGAPGGVVTALLEAATPWVLVVACDMPFVTAAAARALLDQAGEGVDAVVYERGGRLEPLVGVYRASLGAAWRDRLAADPSLQALVASVRLKRCAPADERALDSLNTPEDLVRAGASR